MGASAGTGAGIGIALGLLVLLIAGPGAYYYRKRRRQQATKKQTGDADIWRGDVEYFGHVKPQLDDTSWRVSRSTMDDGRRPVSELPNSRARGLNLYNTPTAQELNTSYEDRRPELRAEVTTPPAAELRTDKSPPTTPKAKEEAASMSVFATEVQEAFTKSEESIKLPILPEPLLPPKRS